MPQNLQMDVKNAIFAFDSSCQLWICGILPHKYTNMWHMVKMYVLSKVFLHTASVVKSAMWNCCGLVLDE